MIETVVAPVIPRSVGKTLSRSANSAGTRTLPLAVPPTPPPTTPADVIYGMGRIDASGRVADRTITQALGWQPGDRLTLTGTSGVVLAHRDPAGLLTLGHKPYVTIPAALRTRCGLQPRDRVLLAATLDNDLLAVYPLSTLHDAIRASLPSEGGESR
jgi:bifunctional DNA-binding transcriptional regulator/antitoxin component of YhaV-PrlF toxin-antitoxin module